MTYDELTDEQKLQVKQAVLIDRARAEGVSWYELSNPVVTDDEARERFRETNFSDDDFIC